jgi:hypothetical protein
MTTPGNDNDEVPESAPQATQAPLRLVHAPRPLTKEERDRLVAIDWVGVRARFLPYALKLTRNKKAADEALQDAQCACADPARSLWHPSIEPVFEKYFFWVLKRVTLHRIDSEAARREYEEEGAKAIATIHGDTAPTPEATHLEHTSEAREDARNERRIDDARRELAGDAEALSLLDAMLHCEKPADQADHLGWTAPDVYRVKKRVLRAVERVRDRERDAGRGADDAATDDDYDEEKP